jgi:hypothetical protein
MGRCNKLNQSAVGEDFAESDYDAAAFFRILFVSPNCFLSQRSPPYRSTLERRRFRHPGAHPLADLGYVDSEHRRTLLRDQSEIRVNISLPGSDRDHESFEATSGTWHLVGIGQRP